MKSTAQSVKGDVHVWALPKSELVAGQDPFTYELSNSASYHWRTGAVCIYSQEVTVEVPAGIDMISMAFTTLESKRKEALATYQYALTEIDKQMNQLMLISHQPTTNDDDYIVISGDTVEDYRGADHE